MEGWHSENRKRNGQAKKRLTAQEKAVMILERQRCVGVKGTQTFELGSVGSQKIGGRSPTQNPSGFWCRKN
jgi:hypothetical protein